MSTGLFANQTRSHRGPGRKAIAGRRSNYHVGALDRFADLLAEHGPDDKGGDVMACAVKLGCSYTYANAMLQRIRKKLGWQAR